MAVTAARRLGLPPRFAHLDRTRFHVDGHDHSAEEPDAHIMHLTRGYSRAHRPDRNPVRLELMVEPQAGIPLLIKPRSGNTRDARDVGQVVGSHIAPLPTTDGTPSLVADRARYRVENLQQLAHTGPPGITRVPATLTEAHHALAHADPTAMEALMEG